MKYKLRKQDKNVLIEIQDEKLNILTAYNYKNLIADLVSDGFTNLIIDLSSVRFTDSTGLSFLLTSHKLCCGNRGICIICGLSENVKRLIEISKLANVLNIRSNVQEGLIFVDSYVH